MAFKIKPFYSGSLSRSSSSDRTFSAGDTKTKDQLKRNDSVDKTPLRMEDAKLMAMKKRAAKLKQEIAAMRAESKKTGKVTNWDDKSDQLSRLNEQIAAYKPKKSE
tara:strand:- start:684 stop:1001 length:318 start_codon:yes stop_codon:yes gene_type:complete